LRIVKIVPMLLGVCALGFAGLLTIGGYEVFTGSPVFPSVTPTATPIPSFLSGVEVRLTNHSFGPVTFWQMQSGCEPGAALGQVPSGTAGRTLEDACYQPIRELYYYRVRTVNGAQGWVEADVIVAASEYVPPTLTPTSTPTATPRPTVRSTASPTATPRPTVRPTPKPVAPSRLQPVEPSKSQPRACCKICRKGKACGDSCISSNKVCHKPPGCACNGW